MGVSLAIILVPWMLPGIGLYCWFPCYLLMKPSDLQFILQNKQNMDIGSNPYNDSGRIVEENNTWLYSYAAAYV